MFALFLSGTIALFLFICFGFFTTKVLSIEGTSFEKVLIGMVAVNILTSFISIFTPISIHILLYVVLTAIACAIYIKNELRGFYKIITSNDHIILFSVPFILVSFSIALQEPSIFDSGLYHIQSIKWIEEYPTVPGLANLHHRFGFNPIAFSLYALTSLQYFFNQEIFSIHLVLFSIVTIYFIHTLYNTLKNNGVNNYFIFYCIFFYVLILLNVKISSPSPDYISSTVLLFIFLRIIEIENSKKAFTFKTFIPIIILSAYCVMVKLSTIPICLITAYILFTYNTNWKTTTRMGIGIIAICIPWLINTVLLTGWLIYPFSSLDLFNFDWKIPTHVVDHLNAEIVGWARSPNNYYYEVAHMPLTKWIPIWWSYLAISIKLLIIGSILLPGILFIGQLIKVVPAKRLLNLCILTSVLGVLFWFFTAPDFRFGHIFILMACCTPLLYFNSTYTLFKNATYIQKRVLFACVCAILLFKSIRNDAHTISKLFYTYKNNTITPKKIISTDAVYTYIYIGSEKIYKPVVDERCFDHPVPCSHADLSSIELRGTHLTSGFRYKLKDK